MRRALPFTLILIGIAGGCGRIGYDRLSASGAGGTAVATGSGGAAGAGTGGTTGTAGATGAAGTGGTAGGGGTTGSAGTTGGTGGSGGAAGVGGTGGGGTAGTGATDGGLGCSMDTFGGHSYTFCLGPLSWTDAANDCALKGMRLARIDDLAENTWMTMTAFAGVGSTSSNFWSWIGGTDQAVVGEWRWTDGALFWLGASNGSAQGGLYNNWVAGAPTNGGGATDCLILQHGAFWSDFDCTRLQRYVCEQY